MRPPGADDSSGAETRSPGAVDPAGSDPETESPAAGNQPRMSCDRLLQNVVT